jgi:hypothetical protein
MSLSLPEKKTPLKNWISLRPDNVHVNIDGKWIPNKPSTNYMYCYGGNGFEKMTETQQKTYVVADYTEKKFEPEFLQKTKGILDNLVNVEIKTKFNFISGVPGCGKTHYIMQHHGDTDLVLSATKAGAIEFRERAKKNHKPNVLERYKTVYAYLYNETKKYNIVYIDEAMMLHPGMICAIAILSDCHTMYMIGDHRQIPYYTRIDYPSIYHNFTNVFPVSEELSVSYRCPQDVALYMQRYYKNFSSKSKVSSSLGRLYVSGKAEIPTGFDVYLTFTQSDKDSIKLDFDNVYTVHEYQGKQCKKVCLYRGMPTPIKVYDSEEHHIVALTRHTEKFIYASVVMDKLYDSIKPTRGAGYKSLTYTDVNIMKNVSKHDILFFDTNKKKGVENDLHTHLKSKLKQFTTKKKMSKPYTDSSSIYLYETLSNRVIYVEMCPDSEGKYKFKHVETALRYVDSICCEYNIKQLHFVDNLSRHIDWRNFSLIVEKLGIGITVHDEKKKLDKFNMSPVIKKYHDLIFGDDIIVDHEYTESNLSILGNMPKCCVLIYTDMRIDLGPTSRFTFVDISGAESKKYNRRLTIYEGNVYQNIAILSKHVHKHRNYATNFKKIETLFKYYDNTSQVSNGIKTLQNFINIILPNACDIRTDKDVYLVANSDITLHLQMASFDASLMHAPQKFFDAVLPVLETAMSPPRPSNSLKELTKAVEKRNCAVPNIQVTLNVWSKAQQLFKKLIKVVYDETVHDDIHITESILQDWLDTQNSNISNLIKYKHYNQLEVNNYSLTIKKNSKPALDMSCVNTYASLQTVVFTPKDFNTLFCPMFKIMKQRMIATMNEKFLMYTDMPPAKFAEAMTRCFNQYKLDQFHSLEFDVSKYDKSQNLLHLIVDCMIMSHFGIPECFVSMWFFGHCNTKLYDPCNRFYCDVFFQRKSGDPSTWLLNTQQILTVIVNCIPDNCWDSIFLVVASGDDSEIFSTNKLQIMQNRFSDVFNYEVKVYDNFTSMYFCSKFIIYTDQKIYMMPDIYKIIKKLGRHDMKNKIHVMSFRNSVMDSLKDFKVPYDVMTLYENAINDRYKFAGAINVFDVYEELCAIAYSEENFQKLYVQNNSYSKIFGDLSDI